MTMVRGSRACALLWAVIMALAVCCTVFGGASAAYAASPLSMDDSGMTVAVGETATRDYSLSTPGSLVNVDGNLAPIPYDMSVLSSDPTVARGSVVDGSLRVHGYSSGQAIITLQALDARGGAAGEVSFVVTVEGDDTTLDQAVIVVGDESMEEAYERIDRANGVEARQEAGASGAVATASGGEAAAGSGGNESAADGSGASSAPRGDTTLGGASSRDGEDSGKPADKQSAFPFAAVAIAALALVVAVAVVLLRKRRRSSDHALECVLVVVVAFGGAAGLAGLPADEAWAYFDRGPVGISVGQYEVVLEEGQSAAIMCAVTPEFDDQLDGCGMAECPQTCGEGCLDSHGQCTCMGLEYKRWYTNVNSMSTNPSVARADYGGGVLVVGGYGPGDATITLTASLKQFQDNSVSIHVVVNAATEDPDSFYVDDEPEDDGSGDVPEQPADEPAADDKGVDGGEGDADTNVVDGSGDAENAKLDPGASADPDASFDKPAAAAAAPEAPSSPEAAPEAPEPEPELPEVPVEPDVSKPIVLFELEEVERADEDETSALDPAAAGATGAAACAFMVLGMAGTATGATRLKVSRADGLCDREVMICGN